jgi:hypothetical protein
MYLRFVFTCLQDVFTVVVQSFAKLDDTEGPLFAKRVSILETVAKVQSCVLMLDLDYDDLILQTFDHFLSTVRYGMYFSVYLLISIVSI